jgi:hypothetical protein
MDILRTHPMVLVGGALKVNPFFVPPDEMLEELKRRKQTQALPDAAGSQSRLPSKT